MKKLFICVFVLFVGCQKIIPFDFPENEKLVFCNCLFSPDEVWKVKVGYTKSFSDPGNDNWIGDATVFVVDDRQDTIRLNHNGEGVYRSKNEKPQEGVNYQLFVITNGDTLSSSKSSIPVGVSFKVSGVEEPTGTVQVGYYSLDGVLDIEGEINLPDQDGQAFMVRSYIFDTVNNGANIYTFNNSVYDSIYHSFGDSLIISKIGCLSGDTLFGYYNVATALVGLLGDDLEYDDLMKIVKASFQGVANERRKEMYRKIYSYSGTLNFERFEFERYTKLGMFYENSSIHIYVSQGYDGEYWMETRALSPEAYLYYKDYISQLSGRVDYSNIQSQVYSNIHNGIGIFAGYKESFVRVK